MGIKDVLDRMHEDVPPWNERHMNENKGGIFVMVSGTAIRVVENLSHHYRLGPPSKVGFKFGQKF
jgi:hypothetical protein